jgi:hypothetical protein
MFLHGLNLGKGWPSPSALDSTHKISPNVLYPLNPGQVCHQNAAGQLEPGVVAWQMPFFLFAGANSLDVMNTPGVNWWPISPTGNVTCFPGIAPMEMWTTEFDTTQTYAPNQPLRAPVGNAANQAGISGTLTNQGVLTWADYVGNNAILPTAICALATMPASPPVSTGQAAPTTPVCTNVNGVLVLSFYPVWFPGHPSQTV